jgi:hypothetical protein
MNTSRRSVVCGIGLLVCLSAPRLFAQAATREESHSFAIHVRLNGKRVDSPQVITLKTEKDEKPVSLQGICFQVPPALLKGKTIDVSFTLPGNRIYLSAIAPGFFNGRWDINLEDKRS